MGYDLETNYVREVDSHVSIEGVGLDILIRQGPPKFGSDIFRLTALVGNLKFGLDNSQLSCVQETQPVGVHVRTFLIGKRFARR